MQIKRADIVSIRLANQQLIQSTFTTPADLVAWFGAVQSQDYSGAKWAVGQRVLHTTDDVIEEAFAKGEILRTHIMRPTWHFVHPKDIIWLLQLTAGRVKATMAFYNRQFGLTETVLAETQKTLIKTLKDGKYQTRTELQKNLKITNGQAMGHILMQAELEGIICSGPRNGKQFTYALLEERAPQTKAFTNEEALAELTKRYFASHGPATIYDFAWWSGLTITDARKGVTLLLSTMQAETIDKKTYYFFPTEVPEITEKIYLLPNYDEYSVAYTDRTEIFDPQYAQHLDSRGNSIFQHAILYRGKIIGFWKKTLKKDAMIISSQFFTKPSQEMVMLFAAAAKQHAEFYKSKILITS